MAGCSSCEHGSAVTAASVDRVIGQPLPSNRNARLGYPSLLMAFDAAGDFYVSRAQYLLAWNPGMRNLSWSAWQLTPSDLGKVSRTNNFVADPDLLRVSPRTVASGDYKGSCFDRGHVTPSGDRTDTRENNRITFYMSNMLPQTAWMNRVPWKHLEEHERELSRKRGMVYVFAGPVYEGEIRHIGPDQDIAVPSHMFKIIASKEGEVLAAVVMPNVTSTGSDPISDRNQACTDSHEIQGDVQHADDWRKYEASVPEIEERTKLRFPFLTSL